MHVVRTRFVEDHVGGKLVRRFVGGQLGIVPGRLIFVLSPPESFDRSRVDCATIDVPAVYDRDSGLPDFRLEMMRVRDG
jgi:hypothetical protein